MRADYTNGVILAKSELGKDLVVYILSDLKPGEHIKIVAKPNGRLDRRNFYYIEGIMVKQVRDFFFFLDNIIHCLFLNKKPSELLSLLWRPLTILKTWCSQQPSNATAPVHVSMIISCFQNSLPV